MGRDRVRREVGDRRRVGPQSLDLDLEPGVARRVDGVALGLVVRLPPLPRAGRDPEAMDEHDRVRSGHEVSSSRGGRSRPARSAAQSHQVPGAHCAGRARFWCRVQRPDSPGTSYPGTASTTGGRSSSPLALPRPHRRAPEERTPMSAFAHVIAPGRIGALELANRVIMPPMGTSLSDADGHFSDRQVAWYAERAGTGAGLVVTELTAVSRDLELTAGLAHADSDAAIPGPHPARPGGARQGRRARGPAHGRPGPQQPRVHARAAAGLGVGQPELLRPDGAVPPADHGRGPHARRPIRRGGRPVRGRGRRHGGPARPHRLPDRPVPRPAVEPPHRRVRRLDQEPRPVRHRDHPGDQGRGPGSADQLPAVRQQQDARQP